MYVNVRRIGQRRGPGTARRGDHTDNFLAELKRRNVVRVGAAYAVVAWLLMQAADILLGNFGAPEWVFKSFTALLLLGFPLALFLAWAYELTPEGVKRSAAVAPDESVPALPGRRLDWLIGVGALAVIALFVVERVWVGGGPGESVTVPAVQVDVERGPARSIAVLAFEDLSPEGDQAYFSEGISEELLNLLARIEDLKVAARTSSFKFKGRQADIGEIGRALNVEAVLEGSVRKAGNQVRVTAQLVDVRSGFHLWSENYDRRLENIFAVQDEIAAAIVKALRVKLDIGAETMARTANVEAYDHYLRGRQLAREPSRATLLRAIEQFERAIALDPGFAEAYAGIADTWVLLEDFGGVPSDEAFPRAESAARRALDLNPHSAEALKAMALVRHAYHRDVPGAAELLERSLQVNPGSADANMWYGRALTQLGQAGRGTEFVRKAAGLDPLSSFKQATLASMLIGTDNDEAGRIIAELLAEDPDNGYAREQLANLYLNQRRLAGALREFRLVHHARPGDPYNAGMAAQVSTYLGDRPLAEAWIAAARAYGEGNRWELYARRAVAQWDGDWAALEQLDQAHLAATGRGDWGAAHRLLLESLRKEGYDGQDMVIPEHIGRLITLSFTERQQDLPDWQQRLAAARESVDGALGQGVQSTAFGNNGYWLARIAAVQGDRDAALAHLHTSVRTGLVTHWFLDRDPVFAAWRDDPEFREIVAGMLAHAARERASLAGMEILP
jgi:TolB-like protein/Tfp pilus assembly protein PilF